MRGRVGFKVRGRPQSPRTEHRAGHRRSPSGHGRGRMMAGNSATPDTPGGARQESIAAVSSSLPLAARVISEGFLPARSALLQGPGSPVTGAVAPDRIRGMLLGLAIGDALGNTSEGMSPTDRAGACGEVRDYLPNRHAGGRRVGLPSDDTQLAYWTLESLLERGDLDPEDLATRFAGQQIFGIGDTVRRFLANRANGVAPWYRCGVESAGNGALMRMAPLVLPHAAGTSAAL